MTAPAYYNENDPKAAAWLRELISAGHIAPGHVDTRSILDVKPEELTHYGQCHFFAGIGGWSYALRLAGWPDNRPVWTGSCPCQPFSAAGKQLGKKDPRHLWPVFKNLIAQCNPSIVFGEQVASRLGRKWLAGVQADLEALAYATAAADLCAASVGAPHIRQRLYWLAYATSARRCGPEREPESDTRIQARLCVPGADGGSRGLADSTSMSGPEQQREQGRRDSQPEHPSESSRFSGVADTEIHRRYGPANSAKSAGRTLIENSSTIGRLADTDVRQSWDGELQPCREHGQQPENSRFVRMGDACAERLQTPEFEDVFGAGGGEERRATGEPGCAPCGMEHSALSEGARFGSFGVDLFGPSDCWSEFDILPCTDGKARRVEPGIFPLAHGVSGRVGLLRGYGNAIVSKVAAQFIVSSDAVILDFERTWTGQ
jgi:DNA (cytosine-5)-methyltransferase 1